MLFLKKEIDQSNSRCYSNSSSIPIPVSKGYSYQVILSLWLNKVSNWYIRDYVIRIVLLFSIDAFERNIGPFLIVRCDLYIQSLMKCITIYRWIQIYSSLFSLRILLIKRYVRPRVKYLCKYIYHNRKNVWCIFIWPRILRTFTGTFREKQCSGMLL